MKRVSQRWPKGRLPGLGVGRSTESTWRETGDDPAYPLRVSPHPVRIGVLAIQGDVREHIHAL
ncbi:MAG: hypothetical protein ABI662_07335, partial [Dermatophilaceae bacterium]